jgi:hypothetical protein
MYSSPNLPLNSTIEKEDFHHIKMPAHEVLNVDEIKN